MQLLYQLHGDIVKYATICLQCCPRGDNPTDENDNNAWLEWAVVWQEERDDTPTVTNIGVAQLSTLCTNFYRQNCLLTGCFPIGAKQAMSQEIKIKLPKKCTRIRIGCTLQIICYVRTSDSTDNRNDSHSRWLKKLPTPGPVLSSRVLACFMGNFPIVTRRCLIYFLI